MAGFEACALLSMQCIVQLATAADAHAGSAAAVPRRAAYLARYVHELAVLMAATVASEAAGRPAGVCWAFNRTPSFRFYERARA